MPFPLSPQSIDAVAEIISGGAGNSTMPPIGIYRSGPRIEKFMRGCNIDFQIIGSRVPCLVERLIALNSAAEYEPLARVIEAATDPRDFVADPERLSTVIEYLNGVLAFDGLALQRQGLAIRLVAVGQASPVLERIPNRAFALAARAIGGNAWDEAGRIWYHALLDPATRENSDFAAFATVTVAVTERLFGTGSTQAAAVGDAWQAVGVL